MHFFLITKPSLNTTEEQSGEHSASFCLEQPQITFEHSTVGTKTKMVRKPYNN